MAHTAPVFGPILVKLHSRSFKQSDAQRLCAPSVNNDARPPKLLSGPRLKIKTASAIPGLGTGFGLSGYENVPAPQNGTDS
jgi:hypothetical protein